MNPGYRRQELLEAAVLVGKIERKDTNDPRPPLQLCDRLFSGRQFLIEPAKMVLNLCFTLPLSLTLIFYTGFQPSIADRRDICHRIFVRHLIDRDTVNGRVAWM